MNKKLLIPFCLALVGFAVVGCGETTTTAPQGEEKTYKLTLGTSVTATLAADANIVTSIDVIAVAAIWDDQGKVVSSYIDELVAPITYSNGAYSFVSEGNTQVSEAGSKNVLSKRELGNEYGMKYGVGEWFEQANAVQDRIEGLTLAEIKAIELNADGVPTDEELSAGCSMKIKSYINVLEAGTDAKFSVTFKASKAPKAGLGILVGKADAKIAFDFAGVASNNGTVLGANLNCHEISMTNGEVSNAVVQSKKALGDNYSMTSGNWAEQTAAYEEEVKGKTISEIKAISSDDLAAAGCTMPNSPATFALSIEEALQHVDGSSYEGDF